ncbi:uncharacterized protein [Panulirus ornatus]|uniref:uncharacterized protein isoform X5 n=1 Tax=Panulirus ornatus TaxID=150431 RepID=UPI003A8692F4
MATVKIKPPPTLGLLLILASCTVVSAQVNLGQGIEKEIFFLNLEDGYFGCQVNESTDVLQLFEVSKLCDGTPNCFLGSDENINELKCTNNCPYTQGYKCINGACLDGQCHCNDGYGGCGCESPDENECKYRPCDVFATCSNTLGSFYCTCFPGYEGDGFSCSDIDECLIPELAARCAADAECCNLPAHYTCKCKEGFTGDGYQLCTDIDECSNPGACGSNAICSNLHGNYTCSCPDGFIGNPYTGCADLDECLRVDTCGPSAKCVNRDGSYECRCPTGFQGDPYSPTGCQDINECEASPCATNAQCVDGLNNFTCACPPGFIGDPYNRRGACQDINECVNPAAAPDHGEDQVEVTTTSSYTFDVTEVDGFVTTLLPEFLEVSSNWTFPCGSSATCMNTLGSYECRCPPGFTGDPQQQCTDINECGLATVCATNAKCLNIPGSYKCYCPSGFQGDGKESCSNVDECLSQPCGANAVCQDNTGSYSCQCREDYTGNAYIGCVDIDECAAFDHPCGTSAVCQNTEPGYTCVCPRGFKPRPTPDVACEQSDVNILCQSNFDCVNNAECREGQCFCRDGFKAVGAECRDEDECLLSPCGLNAQCQNVPGTYQCTCNFGFIGNPPDSPCKAPCDGVECGSNAFCKPHGVEAMCMCNPGWTYDPSDISAGCVDLDECIAGGRPSGQCGDNAVCTNTLGSFSCQCPAGFSGSPYTKCLDVDECRRPGVCGVGALCSNTVGSYTCSCPPGTVPDPDPHTQCLDIMKCSKDDDCPGNALCILKQCMCPEPNIGDDCRHPCEDVRCGPNAGCKLINGQPKCICGQGYSGNPMGVFGCTDIDECSNNPCGVGAICRNEPGTFTCECPSGFEGEPTRDGCKEVKSPGCSPTQPCPSGEQCVADDAIGENVCVCRLGYTRDQSTGRCRDVNECAENRGSQRACGRNANCKNLPGSYDCQCPPGFVGNPFSRCEKCNTLECTCLPPYRIVKGNCVLANCSVDNRCPPGAECVTIQGGLSYCACPSGYTTLPDGSCQDVDECVVRRPDGGPPCALEAECYNQVGGYECRCPPGSSGDPYSTGCSKPKLECSSDSDCEDSERCVQPGRCICPPPYFVDNQDEGKCKSPCEAFSCGINSKCTPSDPPQCMCLPGFADGGPAGCVDINECRGNPCSENAICINEIGTFKCECPPGTVGDPFVGSCIGTQDVSCRSDNDCPGDLACTPTGACVNPCDSLPCGDNAYCEAEEHAAWCRCHPGFAEGPNGDCVSLCEGFLCGENSNCIVARDGPTCKCDSGFNGNPFPGGECLPDQCSPANPCREPQVCVNGRCKERCEGVVCGVGAKCDKNTNKCVCLPFFLGDPDLLCVPPVTPPLCTPGCGGNAHCEYGQPNRCICNTGYSGNPYVSCESEEDSADCATTKCGTSAQCRQGANRVDCVCPVGYRGNPYVECVDVDECIGNACGMNAVCLNTPGSYDCRCQANFFGNPFQMCMPISVEGESCLENPEACGVPCAGVECGPNAVCVEGSCECLEGFEGDADDITEGCQSSDCRNDLDCDDNEICFSINGGRTCVDACNKVECGPNAICVAQSHRSSCLCKENYLGNPNDPVLGCQPADREAECDEDDDCDDEQVCQVDLQGLMVCVDPCLSHTCGQKELCYVQSGRPLCRCDEGYLRNPATSRCQKPAVPDCQSDRDCGASSACRPDQLGVLKCADVCRGFNCPLHSFCFANNHRGQCQCDPGFTGNPNDRSGCRPLPRDECQSDAQCTETEKCEAQGNVRKCVAVCDTTRCGPGAVCIANNHAAQCQCPPGLFAGDPDDPVHGCASVSCITNADCPTDQACNRLEYTCFDVCFDACGDNAICIAENHRYNCKCPPGFRPNPSAEIECKGVDLCDSNPCHSSATCTPSGGTHQCTCPAGMVGDPYTTGCHPEGMCPNGNVDCQLDSVCMNGRCTSPCERACGPNTLCNVVNRKPICNCPPGFQPNPTPDKGCNRVTTLCSSDAQCQGGVCLDGQCRMVCRDNTECAQGERCINNMCMVPCVSSSQCPANQACNSGVCLLGCRGNSDCPIEKGCVNNKCDDPCSKDNVCGPNAQCQVQGHLAKCKCPGGFNPIPTPQQGCIRIPPSCVTTKECGPNTVCDVGKCKPLCQQDTHCAQGESCSGGLCLKICFGDGNCLQGEVCVEGSCLSGCRSNGDCRLNEVCISKKCMCAKGYLPGPSGCVDVDECLEKPCHPSASCINVPGSYKCTCPPFTLGDPYTAPGCVKPDLCTDDSSCEGEQACEKNEEGIFKCVDPCSSAVCGNNARCKVADRKPLCECEPGHYGDPNAISRGCVKGECISNKDCSSNKLCDVQSYKCINPCDSTNCGFGRCQTVDHAAVCYCDRGFQTNTVGGCVDVDECRDSPCHRSALCRNELGSYSCVCPEGQVGDPVVTGCRKPGECLKDDDCPDTAACSNNQCYNPCERPGACGAGAQCRVDDHSAVCFCPSRTTGDPNSACVALQCLSHSDCAADKSCIRNKCVNPCSIPGVCGKNAGCTPRAHLHQCFCQAGFTGDPNLGCTIITYCAVETDCPAGEQCNGGVCVPACTSNRGCLAGQVCIDGSCVPTCRASTDCPDLQVCQNNICVPEVRCRQNTDCETSEECRTNTVGQAECKAACDGLTLCGRSAQCVAINHEPVCQCPQGYFGDPMDERVGCRKIECERDEECRQNERCDNYMCKVACRVNNQCGDNALCVSENHKAVCFCRDGFQGDPLKGCKPIDFCTQKPCGAGASCHNFRGNYKCICPPGTVGDAYNEGCKQPVDCLVNSDCPASAYCGEEDNVPKCKDVCEGSLCGPNSDCGAVNHRAVCTCIEGYEGDATDLVTGCRPQEITCRLNADCPSNTICDGGLCRPPCQSDRECGLTEACKRGQCTNLCDEELSCGLNSICNMVNHKQVCSCPPGFTGKADIECYRIPTACQRNSDCPAGFLCNNGVCNPACTGDSACAQNEKCISGSCMLTCRLDNDCFLGHICLNNICMIGCRANEDCTANQACLSNRCTNPCGASAVCGPNAVCSVVNHRAQCACPQGFIPNPSPNVACSRKPITCNINSDCSSGFVCSSSTCMAICSSSSNCLDNEQCEDSICRPTCRRDDDCRSGDICNQLICVIGCRSDVECPSSQACVNNKCIDPCGSPTACGGNAVCSVLGHNVQCSCPENLVGDPYVNCRFPITSCTSDRNCPDDMTCFSGTCRLLCKNDQTCFDNERCVGGVCKEICNSDTQCGVGNICVGRLCIIGCRSDSTCPSDQSCINRKCRDPCEGDTVCGTCAECRVVNHQAQCSCSANTVGNPHISCTTPMRQCSSDRECGPRGSCKGSFCFKECSSSKQCNCGETCSDDYCYPQCSEDKDCSQGFLCRSGVCAAGCRTNTDCLLTQGCINGKCENPCDDSPCGDNTRCRVSDHRPLCFCLSGFHGNPKEGCEQYDCLSDTDCDREQTCVDRECKNPCLEGICGTNARCRVVNRKVECSCPPNYYGNPQVECKKEINECQNSPCANNAQCINTIGSFLCSCNTGCQGDPYESGCICPEELVDPCKLVSCGQNALCRDVSATQAECYCPKHLPNGDPLVKCTGDCRQTGCGSAASCLRERDGSYTCRCRDSSWTGDPYVECLPAVGCRDDSECPTSQACINNKCLNPCVARNPCTAKEDCKVENQRATCIAVGCRSNTDCPTDSACYNKDCRSPCQERNPCDASERCEVRDHIPFCISESGCERDQDCTPAEACISGHCTNPCVMTSACGLDADCRAFGHTPRCSCPPGYTGDPSHRCFPLPTTGNLGSSISGDPLWGT